MKKSLFALAAVGAFAGAAQAQSSVTVYGILDVGYTGGTARASGTGVTGGTMTENVSRISNSMESGSRLGFRGNEDLGGGTSAQFVIEFGLQPAGNAGGNSNGVNTTTAGSPNASSNTWQPNIRQQFVGLTQKGMGQVRIGIQNTLYWEQAGSNTAGQLTQTFGSVLAPSTDGAYFSGTMGNIAGTGTANQNAAYTARTSNTINLRTERIAGVMAKASYSLSNSDQNQTNLTTGFSGGNNNQSGYQLALDWNIQKANIQASYAAFKSENPYSAAVTTTSGWTPWASGVAGVNVNDNQTLITASYDFGILKAYAGWADRKVTSTLNSNIYLKRTAQEIGVRGYATKTIEYWGSVGNGRYTATGATAPTANITGYQVGSNYWLSKRTNLYAIYGQNGTSSTSANASFNVSQYSLGVRHTF